MSESVYKPSRPGARAIPLSFTGRHLLQSLREAITDAITDGDFNARGGAVSNAREKIAQRMSDLERKSERFFLSEVSTDQLLAELRKRGYVPEDQDVTVDESVNDLLDNGFEVQVRMEQGAYKVSATGVVTPEQASKIGDHWLKREQVRRSEDAVIDNILFGSLNPFRTR